MTSLAFYGGVNTIGGNAILLKDSGCKANIFLDYGLCLSKFKDFYSFPTDAPRYHVEEYTCTGLAPDVPEMYDSTKERFCNSIIVSHPHMDHIGATALVREDVPVYTGDASFKLYDGVMESKTKQNYAIKCHQEKGKNRFCQFRTGETLKFGEKDELRVYPHHIDHSAPGSYAFIVETSDGVVVYTGDFRRHGVVSDFTEKFVRELEDLSEPVEAMVCEGTRIEGGDVPLSEGEVKSYTLDTIESACKSGQITNISIEESVSPLQKKNLEDYRFKTALNVFVHPKVFSPVEFPSTRASNYLRIGLYGVQYYFEILTYSWFY